MKYLVLIVMAFAVAACKERQESAKAPTPSSTEQTATGATQSPGIARSHGIKYQDIARWNDIKNPNQIHEGQALRMTAP